MLLLWNCVASSVGCDELGQLAFCLIEVLWVYLLLADDAATAICTFEETCLHLGRHMVRLLLSPRLLLKLVLHLCDLFYTCFDY